MSDYKPQQGDRVRVVLEGPVTFVSKAGTGFDVGSSVIIDPEPPHVVSIEKIEPDAVLPAGLTLTEDGSLLNWLGENYVRQPVVKPVTVFKPGQTVRNKSTGRLYSLGDGGYWSHTYSQFFVDATQKFTSDRYALVDLK